MSDSWYKVDNVAKVFLATASQRDPRVFRISCMNNLLSICLFHSFNNTKPIDDSLVTI